MKKANPATLLLRRHLAELGLAYTEEFQFNAQRRWRADFLLIEHRILVEIEGGIYIRGRHSRGKGYEADCLKYDHAVMGGFRVLRFSTNQVLRGTAREFLAHWLRPVK